MNTSRLLEETNPESAPLSRYAYDPLGVKTLGWGMRMRSEGESYPSMYIDLQQPRITSLSYSGVPAIQETR
jgi:hypothetical protein